MKYDKSISVIIPAYNVETWLPECLDSVVNQTFSFNEIVVINDGSQDGTLSICEEYASKHDNIRIITQGNAGLGASRNVGMECITSEYFLLLDADDCLELNTNELLQGLLSEQDVEAIYFDASVFGESAYLGIKNPYERNLTCDGEVCCGTDLFSLMYPDGYAQSACLALYSIRKIKELGLLFPEGVYYEDNPFTYKYMIQSARVMHVSEKLYRRRYRSGSITTSSYTEKKFLDYTFVFKNILEFTVEKELYDIAECLWYNLNNACSLIKHYENCLMSAGLDSEKSESAYLEYLSLLENDLFPILHKKNDLKPEINLCLLKILSWMDCHDRIKGKEISQQILSVTEWGKAFYKSIFEKAYFGDENKCIGIWGVGRETENMLEVYTNLIGKPKANINFADTNRQGSLFRGIKVESAEAIANKVDCMIVSSYRYHKEIKREASKYISEDRIIDFYDQYNAPIFSYGDAINKY